MISRLQFFYFVFMLVFICASFSVVISGTIIFFIWFKHTSFIAVHCILPEVSSKNITYFQLFFMFISLANITRGISRFQFYFSYFFFHFRKMNSAKFEAFEKVALSCFRIHLLSIYMSIWYMRRSKIHNFMPLFRRHLFSHFNWFLLFSPPDPVCRLPHFILHCKNIPSNEPREKRYENKIIRGTFEIRNRYWK